MNERIATRWHDLQDSLWLLPGLLTILGAILAVALVQTDHAVWGDGGARDVPLIFGGGVEGARGVLGAIAGSLITVTATVFSITVVTLQLAAGQMTPRVLRSFTGDRRVQFVLGVFIATFTYALLVLRSVRSEAADAEAFVPYIATTAAIVLALGSVGVLIFFIHHIARSIQVSVVVDRAVSDTRDLIAARFPAELGEAVSPGAAIEPPAGSFGAVRAESSGYLQAIDEEALFGVARKGVCRIHAERQIGDFVLKGSILVRIWPAAGVDEALAGQVNRAFVFGPERTLQSDLGLGVRQLTDIALRALSPGINDPTTAVICVDRVCEVLAELARREPPSRVRTDDGGGVLVVWPAPSFEKMSESAFTQIRHYGSADPVVAVHLAAALGRLQDVVPERHRAEVRRQALLVVEDAGRQLRMPVDVVRVEQAAAWTRRPDLAA